ncbi:hypothetical protein [Streptomyces sp. NPDC047525]|uniref:hypothetical protein n=1 Tax=Streptomyces sp. NPDC047525 TaxID=3155264 RepID=UPI0033E20D4C
MRRDRISKLAQRRRQYTNETYAQARSALCPGQPPIPTAPPEQRNFEADVLHQLLDSNGAFTQFTFGIRQVQPGTDSIQLEVESRERADKFLRTILPSYEPGGEVHGLPGLRIRQRTAKAIEIHQLGRQTSVWLSGLSQGEWKRVESDALDILVDLAWRPLWRGPSVMAEWSAEELAFEQRWNTGEWTRNFQAGAWCSSGLLRRLGLFHTLVPADFVYGYKGLGIRGYDGLGPVRWCLNLDHRPGAPYRQAELVDALMDPEFGLPIAPARHLDNIYDPDKMKNWVRLDDTDRTGLIELRFATCNHDSFWSNPKYKAMAAGINTRVNFLLATSRAAVQTSSARWAGAE